MRNVEAPSTVHAKEPGAPHGGEGTPAQRPDDASETKDERMLVCARCGHGITREKERIEVDGRHVHVFVNPSMIEFRIGCFRDAPGCAGVGEESSYWAWFPGHAWRVTVCARCGAHLGWVFTRAETRFYGLILDALA
jgi:hypothetical protein